MIPNTLPSLGHPTPTSCYCMSGSVWNIQSSFCDPQCQTNPLTDGQPANNISGQCVCKAKYLWNATSLTCDADCTNYAYIPNNNQSCDCLNMHYYWNVSSMQCDVNCSTIENGNGTLNETACTCVDKFHWNATEKGCYVNCS